MLPTDDELASFVEEAVGPERVADMAARDREEVFYIIALVMAACSLNGLLAASAAGAGWDAILIALIAAPVLNGSMFAAAMTVYRFRLRDDRRGSALPITAAGLAIAGWLVVLAFALSFSGGGC